MKFNFRERQGASKLYTFIRRVGKKAGLMYKRIGCSTQNRKPSTHSALTQTRYRIQEHHYLKITYQFDPSIFNGGYHQNVHYLFINTIITITYNTISYTCFYSRVSTVSLPLVGKKCSLYGNSKFS